jgi:RNA polymerase sigma-70 factor (ECF subfamily)
MEAFDVNSGEFPWFPCPERIKLWTTRRLRDRFFEPQREGGRVSEKKWFATTHWSLVVAAGNSHSSRSQDALATLCRVYWPPVYSYIRCRGHDPETAQDLAQGFFALLLEKSYLKDVDRERGKFRSFLLASVKHYLANEWDRAHALKRGGGQVLVPLDAQDAESRYGPEPADQETPEKIYEKRWALTLLDNVLDRLEGEMRASGRIERFTKFRPHLTMEGGGESYRDLADELGMSESAIKVSIHRMRRRFGLLLREEVAQTVTDPAKVDDEIRHLFAAMGA